MYSLYDTVARLCTQRGITVSRLCEQAGVSPGILSDLKNGRKKTVSAQTASKLAAALQVPTDTLLQAKQAQPMQDKFLAFYSEKKADLDEADLEEIMLFMEMKVRLHHPENAQ